MKQKKNKIEQYYKDILPTEVNNEVQKELEEIENDQKKELIYFKSEITFNALKNKIPTIFHL